ncbi:MAG TPA: hypothetical protein PK184_16920 [Phycisphaerae bacterium]|jgi:hypothetical protein|nr:hypothetical protein [Phycisphaerae bacterium]HPP22130.1 hypothetical protein [Phycisphaerae bacterium]HPU34381.1 hypothetical protein [Phycisphaerae bacterium]
MGTRERPEFDSAREWKALLDEARANRRAWYVAIATSFLLIALVVAAIIFRLSARFGADTDGRFMAWDRMPAGFDSDHSAEANAFRATCAQCHVLPSPALYDEAGWRLVGQKMGGHITGRGLEIPVHQIELAVEYLIRHGQDAESRRFADR